jgi:hypothetical protein
VSGKGGGQDKSKLPRSEQVGCVQDREQAPASFLLPKVTKVARVGLCLWRARAGLWMASRSGREAH